jgi:hypothetical protein
MFVKFITAGRYFDELIPITATFTLLFSGGMGCIVTGITVVVEVLVFCTVVGAMVVTGIEVVLWVDVDDEVIREVTGCVPGDTPDPPEPLIG